VGNRLDRYWQEREKEFENSLISLGLRAFNMFIEFGIPFLVKSSEDLRLILVQRGITRVRGNEEKIIGVLEELASKGAIKPEDIFSAYQSAPSIAKSIVGGVLSALYSIRDRINLDAMTYENIARWCKENSDSRTAKICRFVLSCPNLTKMVIDFVREELKID